MSRRVKPADALDSELDDVPPSARWRAWMGRIEAVIFAAAAPVSREALARIVGRKANLEALIADICDELRDRPYEIVAVGGGWAFRTKALYAAAIRAAAGARESVDLSKHESLVLTAIAYFQPVTRAQIAEFLGREVSRDAIGSLRSAELIAAGPRSPQPGAPYTYVTTPGFLARFGFESLRDLEDFEQLQDAGLLAGRGPPGDDIARALGCEERGDEFAFGADERDPAIAAE